MLFQSGRLRNRLLPLNALALTLGAGLVAVPAHVAFAQANAGINGTVVDQSGATISGANVTITNVATDISIKTTSSSAGTFNATGLNPGIYKVTVEAPSFKTLVQNEVHIEVSTTSALTFTLTTGAVTDTIQVTASSISLNTTAPQLGSTIEPAVVKALPVEVSGRGRQIDSLQFTAPGITGSTFSHRVSGGVDFSQEILYNGIPVVQPETEGYTTNFNPPFEMVQEFRVERTTFSAQFGFGQGALTYQMASGTNHYHGDLFEINRNSYFDSKGFFNDTVPTDRENNYGFTIGGPLSIPHVYDAKNRTFGHYSQEWFKQVQENTSNSTVPTARQKSGDFSDFTDSSGAVIPIYDPLTGLPFAGNVIPTARFSAASAGLLQYLPDPNRAGLDSNRSAAPFANPNIQHVWGFTVDHNITQAQNIHYTQWRNTFSNYSFDNNPFVLAPNPLNSMKFQPAIGSGFLLNYSNSITPSLLMTAGIGWIGEINNQFNITDFASPVITDGSIPPNITFDGSHALTSWGTSGAWGGSVNRKLGISAVNNWLWTKGRNTFNIGGEFRRAYQDDDEQQTSGGHFAFSQRETSIPDPSDPNFGSYGSSFASFLLGIPDAANRSNSQELRLRNVALSPYIQDDIKLSPKLTLNVGLRWDIMVPFTENNNLIVFLNPTAQNPSADGIAGAATKLGSCTGCAGYNRADTHFAHFGPRFGISYELNSKTVLQGGFSIAVLNGGAYEYGTHKVAVSYGNLLVGSYSRNSTGTNLSAYLPTGQTWDTNPMPNPQLTPFSPSLGVGTQIFAFNKNDGYAPYAEQWNFNVQRELPWNTFLTVAYVGDRVIHLPSQLNPVSQLDPKYLALGNSLGDVFQPGQTQLDGVNVPYTNFANDFGGGATVRQALQPFPQYSNVYNLFDGAGTTLYNGLQVQIEKRLSNGLSFLAGYTLSRSMDNTSSAFATFTSTSLNKFDQKSEWAVSDSDEPQTLKVSGTYELPIGPGKKYFNNKGITGQTLGGWQVSWITDYETGTANGPGQNGFGLGNSSESEARPNRVAGVALNTSYGKIHDTLVGKAAGPATAFNPAAFQTVGTYQLGNSYRAYSGMRNPNTYNEDANIRKHFFLYDKYQFIVQFDYFNLFNRTLLNGPDNNASDSTFGQVTNLSQANSNRQGQIQARFEF